MNGISSAHIRISRRFLLEILFRASYARTSLNLGSCWTKLRKRMPLDIRNQVRLRIQGFSHIQKPDETELLLIRIKME